MEDKKDCTAHILCSSLDEAKTLSSRLRKRNVISYIYTDAMDFWKALETEMGQICLIDVVMLGQCAQGLKNHPQYELGKLPIAFYCNDNTIPLLASSYRVRNLGSLNISNENIDHELNLLVKRALEEQILVQENRKLRGMVFKSEQNFKELLNNQADLKRKSGYLEVYGLIAKYLEQGFGKKTFYETLFEVFEQIPEFHAYSVVEPTDSGSKLVSPQFTGTKYKSFPSLWLGEDTSEDLSRDSYVKNLAHQVAVDYLDENVIAIYLQTAKRGLQGILYLTMENDFKKSFNWSLFESLISGYYSRYDKEDKIEISNKPHYWMSSHEFLSLVKAKSADHKIYLLDFKRLFEKTQEQMQNDFRWSDFYQDFTRSLHARVRFDYKATLFGPATMAFHIKFDSVEKFEEILLSFYKKFAYWRYFADSGLVLAENLTPRIELLESEYKSFCRHLFGEYREKRTPKTAGIMPRQSL